MVWPKSREELEYAVENVNAPISHSLVPSYEPQLTVDEMNEIGVARTSLPVTPTVVKHRAIRDQLQGLLDEGIPPIDPQEYAQLREEVEELIDLPKFYEMEDAAGLKTSEELVHEGRGG